MWQIEHSSWIAAVVSTWSIDSRLTLACQYGSRDEFAIMLARQSTAIDTSWPVAVRRPLWHAIHRSEVWNCGGAAGLPLAAPTPIAARAKTEAPATAATHSVARRAVISTPRADRRRTSPTADRRRPASIDRNGC